MITWVFTNILLTAFAIAFTRLNAKAPHRFRFLVCFIVLCGWLVPWGKVSGLVHTSNMTQQFLRDYVVLHAEVDFQFPINDSKEASVAKFLLSNISLIWIASTALGALLFSASILRYTQFIRRMSLGSVSANRLWVQYPWRAGTKSESNTLPEIRVQQKISGAFTTGVFVPTIWIHNDLLEHQDLNAVLMHEYQHIRNRDNTYLWIMTLIEQVFWWNPLLRYLSWEARRLQELSCDEACANEFYGYRDMLRRIILALSGQTPKRCSQAPGIHHSKSFNIQRLQALEESFVMKPRHHLSAGVFLLSSIFVLSHSLAQDIPVKLTPIDCLLDSAPLVGEALERISECASEDYGQVSTSESAATLREAERLYRETAQAYQDNSTQYEKLTIGKQLRQQEVLIKLLSVKPVDQQERQIENVGQ